MAARRKGRKMTRRRTKQGINVVNVAQSYIVASAATQALFGTNLAAFATQGWLTPKTPAAQMGAGNSWSLSAAELVQGMLGQGFGFGQEFMSSGGGLQSAIMTNLRANGARSLGVIIAAPIAFNIGKKLTAAPRRDINKFLKFGNLKSVVKV
jgi:transcription elongation factor